MNEKNNPDYIKSLLLDTVKEAKKSTKFLLKTSV